MSASWFVPWGGRADAPQRLFCLPYAGGSASAFRGWEALANRLDASVTAVELPGHGRRVGEPPRIDAVEVATALERLIDRPYVLFGHSLGARLGFEVVRVLRTRGTPEPARLFVSGTPGPRLPRVGRGDSTLPDEEFAARVHRMGRTPADVLDDPELSALFLPVLRADFAGGDAYRYRQEPLLSCPISAFAGTADPEAPADAVRAWQAETTGEFRLHVLTGDHFFLHSRAEELFDQVCADLAMSSALTRGTS